MVRSTHTPTRKGKPPALHVERNSTSTDIEQDLQEALCSELPRLGPRAPPRRGLPPPVRPLGYTLESLT